MCSHYELSKLQEEERHNDSDATLTASCQREAQLGLLPPILYRQGATPLHEGENAELLRSVNSLR